MVFSSMQTCGATAGKAYDKLQVKYDRGKAIGFVDITRTRRALDEFQAEVQQVLLHMQVAMHHMRCAN